LDDQRLGVDALEGEVKDVRNHVLLVTVEVDSCSVESLHEASAELDRPAPPLLVFLLEDFCGFGEADDERHRQGARTELALLASAVHQGSQRDGVAATSPYEQCSHTLRGADLVPADADHVDGLFEIISKFAEPLGG